MMRRRRIGAIIGAVMMVISLLLPALPGAVLAGNPDTADAERTIDPGAIGPGGTVEVTVEFESLLDQDQGFALVEQIPEGWVFEDIDDGGAAEVKVGVAAVEWLWLTVEAEGSRTVVYRLTAPDDATADDYPIDGVVKAAGVDNDVLGDDKVIVDVEVPLDGTADASRTIVPKIVGPGGTVEVTVEFESLLDAEQGFALVEQIPEGWVFEDIDDGDAAEVKVGVTAIEWLWLTVEALGSRTVVYRLTAPDDATVGNYPVDGVVKAAGEDNPVLGDTTIAVHVDGTAHASRTIMPRKIEPGGMVWVTVEFESRLDRVGGFALVEDIPPGWEFSPVDDGDADYVKEESPITWLWMTVEAEGTRTVVYTLTAPDDAALKAYPVQGVVKAAGEDNPVLGDDTITVETVEPKPPHDPPKPRYYGLWLDSTDGGSVTKPGEGLFAYEQFSKVNLVASPAQGYRFVEWRGDVRQVDDVEEASAEVTMSYHYFITAVFEPDEEVDDPAVEYDLTILSSEGGSVTTPGEGEFTYPQGTVVDLVAVADADHEFMGWIGDIQQIADTTSAQTTITMQGHYSIGAVFVEHTLTVDSTAGGSVTDPGEGEFTYLWGTVVDLEAVADEGYRFVEWTGDIDDIGNAGAAQTTIAMYDSYSITANFEEIPAYDLTIDSTTGGSVTTPGEGAFTYDDGTVVNLVAQAAENYKFVNWTGDTGTIGNVNAASTNIRMEGDYSITANFEEDDDWERPTGCFIATAAYGTPSAGEIDVLRQFRDVVLLESGAGSRFVAWYYRTSPPIARFLAGHELLRTFTREFLVNPLVWLVEATSNIWKLS